MASEQSFQLGDLGRVTVVDTQSARDHLDSMLELFRRGQSTPLVFGSDGQPEGVVIPFAEWVRYLDLVADSNASIDAEQLTRERAARSAPEDSLPIEQTGWDLDDPSFAGRDDCG